MWFIVKPGYSLRLSSGDAQKYGIHVYFCKTFRWCKKSTSKFIEKDYISVFTFLLGGAKECQSIGKIFPSYLFLAKV